MPVRAPFGRPVHHNFDILFYCHYTNKKYCRRIRWTGKSQGQLVPTPTVWDLVLDIDTDDKGSAWAIHAPEEIAHPGDRMNFEFRIHLTHKSGWTDHFVLTQVWVSKGKSFYADA